MAAPAPRPEKRGEGSCAGFSRLLPDFIIIKRFKEKSARGRLPLKLDFPFVKGPGRLTVVELAPKLKLVRVKDDEYKMVFNMPVRNELPDVRFERDETNEVTGLTFVFKDGRKDFVKKDK